ncbi:MAG: lipopolysaccharide transport periplasmic protein LptA [Immundisolibacteraceae bacterium]|nr:lipopolysaccharide transport periplasmic protein LptA [Immundisolibacteraceae bacterium]
MFTKLVKTRPPANPLSSKTTTFAIFIGLALCSSAGWALDSDSAQPINLEADRAELDDQKGISTYSGRVTLTQGTLELKGDKLIIRSVNGEPQLITTIGKPGKFKQRPQDKPDDVIATATTIKYDVAQEKIILDGNALLIQGNQRFSGAHISYDMLTDKVKALGSVGGESGGRVHMTLPGRQ